MNLLINIAIDDCNPLKGYRILGEKPEKWLRELNERFGAKFTLFIPSNFHNQAKLSENKEWVKELNSIPYFELAAHGFYHDTSDRSKWGECEFFEIKGIDVALERVQMIYDEWNACGLGFEKLGWRSPGWLTSESSKHVIERNFKYAAIHYEHNQGMDWICKTFFGHDGIDKTEIGIHNIHYLDPENPVGTVMFQSHIAGNHNDNVWNQLNLDQLRLSLEHLIQTQNCQFKTLKECL